MPNPKAGTVVPPDDIPRVIEESKAGRVEFRTDKTANVHVPIGKVSFKAEQLYDNMAALMDALKRARPPASKGLYMRRVTLATTMGPGIKIDPMEAQAMEVRAENDLHELIKSLCLRKQARAARMRSGPGA